MRVITGSARGRRLKTPEGYDVRPTTDTVKEAMFNIIQGDIEGRRVLDLFAGTGQLGIECLSRGARDAVFIDSSRQSLALVKENLRACGFEGQTVNTDALSFIARGGKYDIILVDPPYDAGLYESVLEAITRFDILTDGGIIIMESRRERQMPEPAGPYLKVREYNYGRVKLTLYTKRTEQ